MLSAPPVLVEPNAEMFAIEPSPAMQQQTEWAIQTPEASPVWVKASSKTEEEHLSCFKRACQPLFEQMLTRIASHADILENAQPLASRQLIETLCQPYFDQISGKLHDQISGMDDDTTDIVAAKVAGESSKSKAGKRLGRWAEEEESTDAEEGSAFATLLSSDGEGNDVECRTEQGTSSGQISHTLSSEEDSESALDAEKSSMVCRHWKTKGWCRFDAQCKFLHPEHKRGVTVKGADAVDIVVARGRASARKNRGKRNSAKHNQGMSSEVAALDMQPYGVCVTCAPGMWYVEPQLA
jgi:hypothetical protein